jgi:hypothetical protein
MGSSCTTRAVHSSDCHAHKIVRWCMQKCKSGSREEVACAPACCCTSMKVHNPRQNQSRSIPSTPMQCSAPARIMTTTRVVDVYMCRPHLLKLYVTMLHSASSMEGPLACDTILPLSHQLQQHRCCLLPQVDCNRSCYLSPSLLSWD